MQAIGEGRMNNGPEGRYPLPYCDQLPETPTAEEMYLANVNYLWTRPNGQDITRESLAEGTLLQPRVIIY